MDYFQCFQDANLRQHCGVQLAFWKSSVGHIRSQGLPWRRCRGTLVCALSDFTYRRGGDDRTVGLDETEGKIDGSSSKPSSMHNPSMSHGVHAKERRIASTECLFSVYAK